MGDCSRVLQKIKRMERRKEGGRKEGISLGKVEAAKHLTLIRNQSLTYGD